MPPSPLERATSRHRRTSPSVSVVIPVRDPGGLALLLRGLPVVDEVIVVSEGPVADTEAAVRSARPDALVIRPGRPGTGNALASGLAASTGDVVVTLNGDGSTDPGEIPRYVAALTGGADVALGSRYREGGRDLTGGRFRRYADRLLIWLVNAVFGTRRTDPGFGYAAFWRDALDRLDLPDPTGRTAGRWGDGPEIGPLLALRSAARGLRVTEVGSVAYPRMRTRGRGDRAGLRHWIRAMAGEYAGRRTGRHANQTPARTTESAVVWPETDRQPAAEPLWGPPRRRPPSPRRDLWRSADNPVAHTSPRPNQNARPPSWGAGHLKPAGSDAKPRSAEDQRPDPAAARTVPPQPVTGRREVGAKRRRLDGYRQKPDLRLINGEGKGSGRTTSGRLRPVREN